MIDAVDLELAVFESSDDLCTGTLTEMGSSYQTFDLFDEHITVPCLEENRTYFVMVDGSTLNEQGYFDITFTQSAATPIPANDLICSNIDLGTVPISGSINDGVDYSNFCSDAEAGESNPFTIEQTVWFSFTAPNHPGANTSSNVTINVLSDPNAIGNVVDLQLGVYESNDGSCTGTMSLLLNGSDDPVASFDASVSVTCLIPGQEYYVQVDGNITDLEGYFHINIQDDGVGIRPTNNLICNAVALGTVPDGGSINNGVDYTNLCSDTEIGEPVPNVQTIENTVWFTFTAPASGNITINTLNDPNAIGDEVDLQIGVFYSDDNLCTGNFLEAQSSYTAGSKDETITIDCLEAGRLYYIQIDGVGTSPGDLNGWFTIEVVDDGGSSGAPYNNDICNAFDFGLVSTIQALTSETNACANIEVGEQGAGTYATHSVWYEFIAPSSGQVNINVTSTDLIFGMDPEVYIHSSSDNTCLGTFTEVENSVLPTALITENIQSSCLVPGDTYFIQVDGSGLTLEGTFNLSIIDGSPNYGTGLAGDNEPSNNDCANATPLTVQPESCFLGSGVFQTENYGVPTQSYSSSFTQACGNQCGDTWYSFTMPSTGIILIEGNSDNVSGDFSTLNVLAYSGSCGSFTELSCGQGSTCQDLSYQVSVAPGETVYLQVFNEGGIDNTENFQLCLSESCGADDCLFAIANPIHPDIPYCFNTEGATGEDIGAGDRGYNECSEGDNPENSVYYSFIAQDLGFGVDATVTLSVINGLINGSCILGITPTDGFNISLFEDNTPCDNNPAALIDCQAFNSCQAQPVNWSQTYTNLIPNTTYVIQIDGGLGNLGGNNSGSIMIEGDVITPLGVQLISFSGEKQGRSNVLKWTTLNEENNDYFKLFSSNDDLSFELLEEISGHGNSFEEIKYSTIDKTPNNGVTYYKLIQVDFDGVETELDIISVNNERRSYDLLIVPNPVNDISKVVFTSDMKQLSSIKIMTGSGKVISSKDIEINKGVNSISINTSELSSGFYYLIITIDEVQYSAKFIKS